jgi:small subunit ribosomal protein S4
VNGHKVNVPSYNVKPGDVIDIRDAAVSRQLVTKSLESAQIRPVPEWIGLNRDALRAQIVRMPTRDDIQPIVNEQLIVEFYSR